MRDDFPMRLILGLSLLPCALSGDAQTAAPAAATLVLDRVVAVVNNRAVLDSDVDEEMRLAVLEPNVTPDKETRRDALSRIISRTLIRQQIRAEDAVATAATPEEIAERLKEMRTQVPACVREKCTTDADWKAFLERHNLVESEVEDYVRNRIEILRFIEMRFRQGIEISHDQIAAYYNGTLLPQYHQNQHAPTLAQVAPRIEEILLQQQVTTLFSDWLVSLRKQGEVEVLDASLTTPDAGDTGAKSQ